jgi:hypothetical protein
MSFFSCCKLQEKTTKNSLKKNIKDYHNVCFKSGNFPKTFLIVPIIFFRCEVLNCWVSHTCIDFYVKVVQFH